VELATDRVLDKRYRIMEPIGQGGSSQVYLAYDEQLHRDVAVKVLDPQAASDSNLRKLFVREAQALAKVSHPNVVAVYDVGEVDGLPYIVMEHLPGRSLKQKIDQDGPLAVGEAARLGTEIAHGLAFAHSRGIVHADMKPSNVLLDEAGHAKIADFGIARKPEEEATTPQLVATAMYVAPERIEGKGVTPATDIYGLGLVLYEMLVGRPPFTSTNPAVLLRDHVVRQPVPPSHLRQSLPRELDAIVMKCIAKDPSLRYMRASDVAKALGSLENVGHALATTRVGLMNEPLQGIVPHTEESPVVAFLQAYGHPIRRGFFAILAAAPVFALVSLAQFDTIPALIAAVAVAAVATSGHLALALALGWVIETACIFLFVPALAVVFAFMGLWVWLRDVPPERTATALAMPALGPVGLAPAFVLASAAIHGLGGVIGVAWGAVLTVLFAVSAGRASLGPFIQTGIALEPATLFDPARALDTKAAILYVVRPGVDDRFGPLLKVFDPQKLADQVGTLVSRVSTADVAAIATVAAWVVAALVVWTVTRLLRSLFDTIFGTRRIFAVYVFATAVGVISGAAILYMTYVTWAPLAFAPGHPASAVLFVSAVVGAIVALALGVVVSATESPHTDDEMLTAPAGAA
jgi:tRNA A-37 threonylcarbamoyl transferase component Bud32